jgi:hypothetical protein
VGTRGRVSSSQRRSGIRVRGGPGAVTAGLVWGPGRQHASGVVGLTSSEMPLTEIRSMRANAGQVLAFYGDRIERGGLPERKSRRRVAVVPAFVRKTPNTFFGSTSTSIRIWSFGPSILAPRLFVNANQQSRALCCWWAETRSGSRCGIHTPPTSIGRPWMRYAIPSLRTPGERRLGQNRSSGGCCRRGLSLVSIA